MGLLAGVSVRRQGHIPMRGVTGIFWLLADHAARRCFS
jgi:hypothetical protein